MAVLSNLTRNFPPFAHTTFARRDIDWGVEGNLQDVSTEILGNH
jgi:hypothetical protein